MRHACLVGLVLVAAGCRGGDRPDPDAQQLARINKELGGLMSRLDALTQRMEHLEARGRLPAGDVTPLLAIDAPGAAEAATARHVIAVGDTLLVDDQPVAEADLGPHLGALAAASPDAQLIIRATDATPHGRVIAVLDLARQHGFQRIAFEAGAGR